MRPIPWDFAVWRAAWYVGWALSPTPTRGLQRIHLLGEGVALINHYIVDMDSVREWANELHDRRTVITEDDDKALRDPLPEKVDSLEPASVHWRLSMVFPAAQSAATPMGANVNRARSTRPATPMSR